MKYLYNSVIFLLAMLFVFSFSHIGFSESSEMFYVLHIKGEIIIKSTGHTLQVGDQFSANEELLFKTPDSVADVINPQQGRFILQGKHLKSDQQESELIGFAKECFLPTRKAVSTRSNLVSDLQKHFSTSPYVILGRLSVKIDPLNFPMNKTSFFYVRYTFRGETINKPLAYQGDILFIEKKSLYMVDDVPIAPEDTSEMALHYYQTQEGQKPVSTRIADFDPVFLDEEQLKRELHGLILPLREIQKPEEEIRQEVFNFLFQWYGEANMDNVKDWLDANF